MFEYKNHTTKMKNRDLVIKTVITLVVIFLIALALSGCSKHHQAKLELKEICEDGYVYKVYGYNKKEVVIENGKFKTCNNREIEF